MPSAISLSTAIANACTAQRWLHQILGCSRWSAYSNLPYTGADIRRLYNMGGSRPVSGEPIIGLFEPTEFYTETDYDERFHTIALQETLLLLKKQRVEFLIPDSFRPTVNAREALGDWELEEQDLGPGKIAGHILPQPRSHEGDVWKLYYCWLDSLEASGNSLLHLDFITFARRIALISEIRTGRVWFAQERLLRLLGGRQVAERWMHTLPGYGEPRARYAAEGMDLLRHEVRREIEFLETKPFLDEPGAYPGVRVLQRRDSLNAVIPDLLKRPGLSRSEGRNLKHLLLQI